jgi:flagellar protein FliL
MKQIIPIIMVLVFVAAGALGGSLLKAGGAAGPVGEKQVKEEGHDKKGGEDKKTSKGDHGSDKKDKKEKKEKKGKGDHGGKSDGPVNEVSFYKFSREFVVPIIRDSRVDALVILNISLEVEGDTAQKLFTLDPKLRDNIMSTLIVLSNEPGLFDNMTQVENYERIRSQVLENLRNVIPEGINNVLILDFAKQDTPK